MDNRQFNINGRTKKQLNLALKCLLFNEYDEEKTVSGWYFNPNKGFVLTWWVGENYIATPFTDRMGKPKPVNVEDLTEILWEWLTTDEAKTVEMSGWDEDADHDGSNELGWRLYMEDWGHVNMGGSHSLDHYSIAAFKPAYLWYGK